MNRIVLGSAAFAAAALVAQPAHASGFLAARFGGEHGHPTTRNPTALYYNPAGLALPGAHPTDGNGWNFRLYLDGTFALRTADYTRPAEAIDDPGGRTPSDAIGANAGEANLSNFIASPFVAVTSDFGIPNFGAALGLYVPFGGVASWDQNENAPLQEQYPGGVDGVQRWWTMDGRIQALYVTGAAAYTFPDLRLSVGLGVNAIQSTVRTIRARNADGSDDLVSNAGTLKEGRSFVDVSSWDIGLSAGVIWEPVERVWLGVSYQSQPGFGENTLSGTLDTTLGTAPPDETQVELKQSLPDVWRFGARWQPDDRWELRLFGEYVRWSVFEQQCILVKEDAQGNEITDRNCSFNPDGSLAEDGAAVTQNIPRDWKDAFGIRAGVSYWFTPEIEGFVGAGYDGNAVPDATIDPALIDMPKWTASIGGQFQLTPSWLLAGTFTQVFYQERDVAVEDVQRFQPPSRQPNAAGVYNQSISVLNVYTQYAF